MKYSRTLLALASVALLAQGCKNDAAEGDTIVINNGNPLGSPAITYTIQVVDAAGNVAGRTAGVPGVSISYRNAAGDNKTVATNETGAVVLTDVAPGSFMGHTDAEGYASMDFTTDLSAGTNGFSDSGKVYFASTRLTAIAANAVVTGQVYGDYRNLGTTPNPQQANFQRTVNLKVYYEVAQSGNSAYPMGSGAGRITSLALDPTTVTIESSPNGQFTQDGLAATQSGIVSAYLSMRPLSITTGSGSNTTTRSFSIQQSNNEVPLELSSGDTLRLGNLLSVGR